MELFSVYLLYVRPVGVSVVQVGGTESFPIRLNLLNEPLRIGLPSEPPIAKTVTGSGPAFWVSIQCPFDEGSQLWRIFLKLSLKVYLLPQDIVNSLVVVL